jgi:flagellar FliL protein
MAAPRPAPEEIGDATESLEAAEALQAVRSKRKLVIIAAAVVLLVGFPVAAYFTGLADPLVAMITGGDPAADGAGAAATEDKSTREPVYYELPEFVVNLNTRDRRTSYLKLRANLELETGEDIPRIASRMPRIVDSFQVYLRELRLDDVKGSAGTYRLREELLRRISQEVSPARVRDVLFLEMFIQ